MKTLFLRLLYDLTGIHNNILLGAIYAVLIFVTFYFIIIIPIKKQLERAKLYSKTTERLLGDCALLFFVIAVLAAALDLNLISFLLINLFLVRLISEKNMGILSHFSIIDKLRTNVNELNTCLIACYHEAIVIETTKIGLRNILPSLLKSLRAKYSVEKYFTKAQIPIYVTTLKSTFWLTAEYPH